MFKRLIALLVTALTAFGLVRWLRHRREVPVTPVAEPEVKAA